MTPEAARDAVVEAARRHGFHRVALVPVEPPRRADLYRAWLAAGRHGEMAYLAAPDHVGPRADLRAVLSEVRTLVVVALAHDRGPPPPAPGAPAPVRGRIARYAAGDDYHVVMKARLAAVADDVARAAGAPVAARACVDTAPVLEREWAERGGLGFIAKNTMLIAPGLGSYVLLGELLLGLDAAPTAPAEPPPPRCGSCRACLDACPTGAFQGAYVLDARRCISYLTIEHAGAIPRALRPAMGTWVFGCDVCQEVCPYNAADRTAGGAVPARDLDHRLPDLARLAGLGANQLRRFVRRTALRRIDRARLRRNVAVALGNSGDARALAALAALAADPAALVRGHAAWAIARLVALGAIVPDAARALLAPLAADPDPEVRAEAAAALADLAQRPDGAPAPAGKLTT
jgi:epoxyqueuosine reductase